MSEFHNAKAAHDGFSDIAQMRAFAGNLIVDRHGIPQGFRHGIPQCLMRW